MDQARLLPIFCDLTFNPPTSAADAACIAQNSATQKRYLCKSLEKYPQLPAVEWICASLARDCGLSTPNFSIVQAVGHANLLFGSEWEDGAMDWLTSIHAVTNTEVFSQTYAFDNVVHNEDRHVNNFLYLDLGGTIVAKVIDASRALMYNGWPLPGLPLKSNCHTITTREAYLDLFPQQAHLSDALFATILNLPDSWMEKVIGDMPAEWIDTDLAEGLCAWWKTDRPKRINSAKGCLI